VTENDLLAVIVAAAGDEREGRRCHRVNWRVLSRPR